LEKLAHHDFDVLLFDLHLAKGRREGLDLIPHFLTAYGELKVVALSTQNSVSAGVDALQAGAVDCLSRPLTKGNLERCLVRIEKMQLTGSQKKSEIKKECDPKPPEGMFETLVPEMRAVFDLATRAAPTPTTLLLLGESGTGKTTL